MKMLVAACAALIASVACSAPPHTHDAVGTTRARIVALMPFVADDAYAIGAGSQLVAVSSFTDDTRARALPRIADVTSVDAERIVGLRPDVAVGIVAQKRLADPLRRAGIDVVLLHDDAFDDIFTNLHAVGALSGHAAEAAAAIARLRRTTAQLRASTRTFKRTPSVFVVLGSTPIWTAGSTSYIATLIALAGGRNAADDLHLAYGQYAAEALLRNQPDVLVSDPAIRLDAVLGQEPWRSLRAVRLGRVYAVRPAEIIERPGPQYNDGIRWLVKRLAPIATSS